MLSVVLLAPTLAACGHVTRAGHSRIVQVALSEYRLAPQRLEAPSGPLTLVAHNFGHLVHNLAVMRGARTVEETAPIAPGQTRTLTVDLAPGRYTVSSNLFDDQALGAYGALTVTR